MKLILQAESLTETAFPCWRKFIWWLAEEKASALYISPNLTKKRRLRIENRILKHAPGLALNPFPGPGREDFSSTVENVVYLSFTHPAANPLLDKDPPAEGKIIQAVDITAQDFPRQLEICQRAGVSSVLIDRLPDEISVSLPVALHEYFLSHFLFLPPIVEFPAHDLKKEKPNESVLIIYESKPHRPAGKPLLAKSGQEEGKNFEFSENLSHLRGPLKNTGKVDFLDLSSSRTLYDLKLTELLFRYPAWVITASDPQLSLYLSLLAKWKGIHVCHFEPAACSPFRFAGAGIFRGETDFDLGARPGSVRESLRWLLSMLNEGIGDTVTSQKELLNNNKLPDVFSVTSQWKRLSYALGETTSTGQNQEELLFWEKIYRPRAALSGEARQSRQIRRPGIVLSMAKRRLFQSPFFGPALHEAIGCLGEPNKNAGQKLAVSETFGKQLRRLFPEYLMTYFEPDWAGKIVRLMEKFPWLPEECDRAAERLSRNPAHLEHLLENLYSAMLQIGNLPDSRGEDTWRKFASFVIDGLSRHNLNPSSSRSISRLYLRSLVFLGKISEAEQIAEQVYSRNPLAKNRFSMMAQAFDEIGNRVKAVEYFERDLREARISVSYIDAYARSFLQQGDLHKSVQTVCRLNESGHNTSGVYTSLARAYTEFERDVLQYSRPRGEFLSNLRQLANFMEEEITTGSNAPDTWLIFGRIQNWLDEPEKALETFKNGMGGSDLGMTRTLAIEMASCLGRNHCEKDGLTAFREEFSEKKQFDGLLSEFARGLLNSVCFFFDPESRHFHDRQIREGENLLEKEINFGNPGPFTYNLKAYCEMIRGEPEEAIQTVEEGRSSGKTTPLVQVSNAFALWWFGFTDLAKSEIRKVDSLLSNTVGELFFRAATLAVCGFREEALWHYKGLYDANPYFFDPGRQLNRNLWFWQMAACHSLGDCQGVTLFADLARNYDPLFEVKDAWFEKIKHSNAERSSLKERMSMPPFRISQRKFTQARSSFARKHQILQTTH